MLKEDVVELRWVFSVIRRWLWLIVACSLLGAIGAYLVVSRMPPMYNASATLLVQVAPNSEPTDYNAIRASEQLALTYNQMLKGRPVMEAAAAKLGLKETPGALAKRVKTNLVKETQLIQLSVEHTDPDSAALIANSVAETFVAQVQAMNEQRFAGSLTGIQEQIDEFPALIEQTQAEIDTLRISMIQEESESARLETLLAEYRNTYNALQQNYTQMRLKAAQATNNVIVLDTAQISQSLVQPSTIVTTPSPYTATTTLMIRQAADTETSDYNAILASELLARTYSQMLNGRLVMQAAIAQLGLEETPEELASRSQVRSIPDTQLIQLSVADADPDRAVLIADTIAQAFIARVETLQAERYADSLTSTQEQIDELSGSIEETQAQIDALREKAIQEQTDLARLEARLEEHHSTYKALQQDYKEMRLSVDQATDNVTIAVMAQVPDKPVQRSNLYVALAAMVGATLGLAVAFLIEYLDDTIKTPDDVRRALGLDTLGAIGRLARGGEELVVAAQPFSPVAETFRVLRTNIRFSSIDRPLHTLLVTSPSPLEGKSVTAANLAVAMAQTGLRVMAVDADLHRPRLGSIFGLDPRQSGLSGALLKGTIDGTIQPTLQEGLNVVPSGQLPPNQAELLGSRSMQELLHELTQQVDLVLIDSPPVLALADAALLAGEVDGVLLVIDARKTRREPARHAVERLRHVGANIVGVVLTAVPGQADSYYSYSERHENGAKTPTRAPHRWRDLLAVVVQRFSGKGHQAS